MLDINSATDESKALIPLINSSWLYFIESDFTSCIDKYSKGVSFVLNRNAKVYTINTVEDYKKLYYDGYTIHCDETNYKYTRSIDFEKLSKDYDAFHLTEDAFYYMRLPMYDDILKVNYTTASSEEDKINWKPVVLNNFYSYDCETWIIFNLDCINKGSILNHYYKLQPMYDE